MYYNYTSKLYNNFFSSFTALCIIRRCVFLLNGKSTRSRPIYIHAALNRVAGCRLPFKIDRPLFPTSTFTKTQFTEWAEPIPASEVHPPCSRGAAIVREPPNGEEERVRSGRMVSGRWYVYVRSTVEKSGPFPQSSNVVSYAFRARARINFNRLPIFSRSLIPPRGYRERSP